jgi:hypothetical protein
LRQRRPPTLLLTCLALAACRPTPGSPPAASAQAPAGVGLRELPFPAAAGSGEVNLAATADGRVLAAWLEPRPGEAHALRFSELATGHWSEPRTITSGRDLFVNFADFPSLAAAPDGTLWAHWLRRRGAGAVYDVQLSISRDGGATWDRPRTPHRDGLLAEHGFVSLAADGSGLDLVWLDGRQAGGGAHGHGGATQLRHARVGAQGDLGPESVLDARVCDCCQTALTRTSRGLLAAYRDRGEDELRDIALVLRAGPTWSEPRPLARDGWRIDGCPVNGPALASDGARVVAAWYSAALAPRVRVAFSADGGATFGPGQRVDDGRPIGRVDAVLLADGTALVS